MYTPDEIDALKNLFAPVAPLFTISRPAMKKLATQKLAELREERPDKELYWINLEIDLETLLNEPTQH
jgi:hypothetical protein